MPVATSAQVLEEFYETAGYDFDTELHIRIETIGDRRRVYTALTDLHGLDILTAESNGILC